MKTDRNTALVLEGGVDFAGFLPAGYWIVSWTTVSVSLSLSVLVQEHATGFRICPVNEEEKSSSARVMDIVRASSSLPFVSPITYVDGVPMLDGERYRKTEFTISGRLRHCGRIDSGASAVSSAVIADYSK